VYPASHFIGRAIVSAESGARLGRIADLLFGKQRLVGFVVRIGWWGHERVLLQRDVQEFADDPIIARTVRDFLDPRQWRESEIQAVRVSALRRKRVTTRSGRYVGFVKDVYLDERTGVIDGYAIIEPAFSGLGTRRSVLPQSDDVTCGQDALVIKDDEIAADPSCRSRSVSR
jgi:uncharacterized protein YrrD